MTDFIENKGYVILNGYVRGNGEEEYKFIGARGNTVIDYIIVNEKMWEKVKEFRVESRLDSDHAPVYAYVSTSTCSKRERNTDSNTIERQIITWGEEDFEKFKSVTEVIDCVEEKEEDPVEFRWAILKSVVNESVKRKFIKIKKIEDRYETMVG